MTDERTGLYSIGVVARLTGLHVQTIRQYERLGLIEPQRTPGGTRVFSEHDLRTLNSIASLTRDMGVNLAGVEVILKMRHRHQRLVAILNEMLGYLDEAARARFEAHLRGDEPGLVPRGDTRLARTEPPAGRRRIPVEGEE